MGKVEEIVREVGWKWEGRLYEPELGWWKSLYPGDGKKFLVLTNRGGKYYASTIATLIDLDELRDYFRQIEQAVRILEELRRLGL